MVTPAKLCIVFDDSDICKLILPSGIPSSLTDLFGVIRQTFNIPGDFSLLYQDIDFDGQFFTLSCIEQVEDKATVKVVPTQPILLTVTSVEETQVDPPLPEESSSCSSAHS